MQLTPFCLMLSCLRINPDRSQYFRYETVSLTCEDQWNTTGWMVKRKTPGGGVRPCSSGWGFSSSGSTCTIQVTYPSDSGMYWCENVEGKRSNSINITITDRTVILESPALPVSAGAAVTLRCKAEVNSTDHLFDFYKDGHCLSSGSRGEMTIRSTSESDEGLYKCSVSGGRESRASWLAVDAPLPTSASTLTMASRSCSVFRFLCHVLVGIPYLLSTILLGLIYRDRKRAAGTVAERRGSNDVIMEIEL